MITKEQLQVMSDFEVNKALAELLRWEVAEICDNSVLGMTTKFHEKYPNTLWVHKAPNQAWEQVCFTHTPDDIMPMAFEHKLSLHHVTDRENGYWLAGSNTYHCCKDTNPLRAIACCLILVLQEQKQ